MALGFDWLNIDALDRTQGVALQESLYGIAMATVEEDARAE